MYTLPRHGMRHLGRIDEPSISCDQDILYGKKRIRCQTKREEDDDEEEDEKVGGRTGT